VFSVDCAQQTKEKEMAKVTGVVNTETVYTLEISQSEVDALASLIGTLSQASPLGELFNALCDNADASYMSYRLFDRAGKSLIGLSLEEK
jgi:hypothetical protein